MVLTSDEKLEAQSTQICYITEWTFVWKSGIVFVLFGGVLSGVKLLFSSVGFQI